MANGTQIHERVPENLRKQFAVAVRSIKWSYAIFWSLSTTQQGYHLNSFKYRFSFSLCISLVKNFLVFLTSVFLQVQSTIFPNQVRPRLEVYSSISVPNGKMLE